MFRISMASRTPLEYLESLKDGREVYYRGRRVDDVTKHELLSIPVKHAAMLYEFKRDEKFSEMANYSDPDIGLMSMFYKIPKSSEDLLKRHELIKESTRYCNGVFNIIQVAGSDVLFSLLITSAKSGDSVLRQRVQKYYRYVVENDLAIAERTEVLQINEQLASEGMRVLAVACKELEGDGDGDPETGLTFLGLVGLIDPPRPGAVEAIASAKSAGVIPVMITGDHRLTAVSIAKECGIDVDVVLTGKELERMSPDELAEVVERVRVYARTTPSQKLKIVEAWKKRDYIVAMTGDGVNDAPALKRADIGVSMGIRGTEVAKEASDIILIDDSLPTLVRAIELGRWIFDNIKKYLAYLLQANLVEIVVLSVTTLVILRALGYSGEEALALLPVQILYINPAPRSPLGGRP